MHARIGLTLAALALAAAALTQQPKRPPITGLAPMSRHFYKDLLGYDQPFQFKKPNSSLALSP